MTILEQENFSKEMYSKIYENFQNAKENFDHLDTMAVESTESIEVFCWSIGIPCMWKIYIENELLMAVLKSCVFIVFF